MIDARITRVAALGLMLVLAAGAPAWEHQDSPVDFVEYSDDVVARYAERGKPFFLLFSAEWCFWCHVLSEKTLADEAVYTYLNERFTNVFVDADIHASLGIRYGASAIPYTVFLNPDGSLFFKYGGVLYGDDFLDVLRRIDAEVDRGGDGVAGADVGAAYAEPASVAAEDLAALARRFEEGVLEGFDAEAGGLGLGEKALLPRTFLRLLESPDAARRSAAVRAVRDAVTKAIKHIYDPLEGGFFRYAETREWAIPHYEKMADLNAGAVLVLYRLNAVSPSPRFEAAADRTLRYLTTTLFDSETGAFLSFQAADERYYHLDAAGRAGMTRPVVIDKIFTERLATTLDYLLDVLEHTSEHALREKIVRSLGFLSDMLGGSDGVRRVYDLARGRWERDGGLHDHATLARMLVRAGSRLGEPGYRALARRVVEAAAERFLDEERGVFIDPTARADLEYLMEANGLLAQAIAALGPDAPPRSAGVAESIVRYFSAMDEALDDRLWEGEDWAFAERYVPYLEAADRMRTAGR